MVWKSFPSIKEKITMEIGLPSEMYLQFKFINRTHIVNIVTIILEYLEIYTRYNLLVISIYKKNIKW